MNGRYRRIGEFDRSDSKFDGFELIIEMFDHNALAFEKVTKKRREMLLWNAHDSGYGRERRSWRIVQKFRRKRMSCHIPA
jgi:hypothetical protein